MIFYECRNIIILFKRKSFLNILTIWETMMNIALKNKCTTHTITHYRLNPSHKCPSKSTFDSNFFRENTRHRVELNFFCEISETLVTVIIVIVFDRNFTKIFIPSIFYSCRAEYYDTYNCTPT